MQTIRTCLFNILAGLLILGLILTGCSAKEAAAPQDSTPPLSIERKVHAETFLDENDGTVLLTLNITYPQIKNPENKVGIAKINEYYGRQYDEFMNRAITDGRKIAKGDKEAAQDSGFEFRPYAYGRDAEIYYNGNNLLSVVNLQYENTGGAHPNSWWTSETFDVKTGEQLALADILGGSREEALEKVYQTVLEQIQKTEGTEKFVYQDNYQENVRNSFSAKDFVLTSNSLMVYYQPYAIAAYAAGIPKFELLYSQMKPPALKIPVLPQDSSERDLYEQVGRLIENNNWNDYSYFLENISENSATLNIRATDNSPAGKKAITITGKLKKENGVWLLEEMDQ